MASRVQFRLGGQGTSWLCLAWWRMVWRRKAVEDWHRVDWQGLARAGGHEGECSGAARSVAAVKASMETERLG